MNILIRRATLENADELSHVGIASFTETWADNYTEEILSTYLKEKYAPEIIRQELQQPEIVYYSAFHESEMIGFVKISRKQELAEWITGNSLEVCRIYVLNAYHNLKVGKLLMESAIELAKVEMMDSIVLGVWEGNQRAISFYQKFGFEKIGTHPFIMAHLIETDWVMEKRLDLRMKV